MKEAYIYNVFLLTYSTISNGRAPCETSPDKLIRPYMLALLCLVSKGMCVEEITGTETFQLSILWWERNAMPLKTRPRWTYPTR